MTGCQTFYLQHPVVVLVRDAETKQPIPTASAQIICLRTTASRPLDDSAEKADPTGIARLSTEPNGQGYPHRIEAIAKGYMLGSMPVSDAQIEEIKTVGWFDDAKQRSPEFVVELYAEPKFSIEMVLAPGFRGVIKAEVKIQEDMTFPAGQRKFSYNVEPDGFVRVVGPRVALQRVALGNYVARDSVGSLITATADPAQVGLRCFKHDKQFQYFFVGTQDDWDRYRRNLPEEEKVYTNQSSGRSSGGGGGGGRGGRGGGGGRGGMGGGGGMGSGSMPGSIPAN